MFNNCWAIVFHKHLPNIYDKCYQMIGESIWQTIIICWYKHLQTIGIFLTFIKTLVNGSSNIEQKSHNGCHKKTIILATIPNGSYWMSYKKCHIPKDHIGYYTKKVILVVMPKRSYWLSYQKCHIGCHTKKIILVVYQNSYFDSYAKRAILGHLGCNTKSFFCLSYCNAILFAIQTWGCDCLYILTWYSVWQWPLTSPHIAIQCCWSLVLL